MKNNKVKKILIFRVGPLGDSFVSIPVFHLIANSYPTSECILLTNVISLDNVKARPPNDILYDVGLICEH